MTTALHVLVTGCGGAVGRPVCAALREAGHRVRGLDLQPFDGVDSLVVGDIADAAAVAEAITGVDRIVHLAANPHNQAFVERLVQPNVVGLFHVMDQAREQGVPRVVLASSMQVVRGIRGQRPLTPADSEPGNHYALTKLWAEQMGRMYAKNHGLEVIAARIGWLPRNREECERLERSRSFASYVSPGDIGRYFLAAVTAPATALRPVNGDAPPFLVTYVTGPQDADRPQVDLTSALALGYTPQHVYPAGVDFAPCQALPGCSSGSRP